MHRRTGDRDDGSASHSRHEDKQKPSLQIVQSRFHKDNCSLNGKKMNFNFKPGRVLCLSGSEVESQREFISSDEKLIGLLEILQRQFALLQ